MTPPWPCCPLAQQWDSQPRPCQCLETQQTILWDAFSSQGGEGGGDGIGGQKPDVAMQLTQKSAPARVSLCWLQLPLPTPTCWGCAVGTAGMGQHPDLSREMGCKTLSDSIYSSVPECLMVHLGQAVPMSTKTSGTSSWWWQDTR